MPKPKRPKRKRPRDLVDRFCEAIAHLTAERAARSTGAWCTTWRAVLVGLLINRDRSHSPTDVRFAPTSGGKADVPGGPSWAINRHREWRARCPLRAIPVIRFIRHQCHTLMIGSKMARH